MLSWVLQIFSTQFHSDLLKNLFSPSELTLESNKEFIIFAIISKFTRKIDVCSFVVRIFQVYKLSSQKLHKSFLQMQVETQMQVLWLLFWHSKNIPQASAFMKHGTHSFFIEQGLHFNF